MPELLLQSALAASKSRELAGQAAQIKAECHTQHGDSKSLVSCPPCYGAILEALKVRFLSSVAGTSASGTPPDQQHPQRQREEWFTSRRAFLSALELLIDSAKEYQISPQAIDDRIREERSSWYAERVRGSLLRLMVEDAAARSAVFEKLEDSSAASAAEGDPVRLAREVAEILSRGSLAAGKRPDAHLLERLAAAEDEIGTIEVLEEMFFAGEDGTVPEDDQKYLDMLLHHGLTMEQVVDRILEERQAAVGAREQTAKLKARLDELRRARAAHEAHKTRKARRRESLAQQKAPDELYALPPCAVCGEAPSTKNIFCCTLCTILAGHGVQERQTVFCSKKCEEKGYVSPPSPPRPLISNINTPSRPLTQTPTSALPHGIAFKSTPDLNPPPPGAGRKTLPPPQWTRSHHQPTIPSTSTPISAPNVLPLSSNRQHGARRPARQPTSSRTATRCTCRRARPWACRLTTRRGSSISGTTTTMAMVAAAEVGDGIVLGISGR